MLFSDAPQGSNGYSFRCSSKMELIKLAIYSLIKKITGRKKKTHRQVGFERTSSRLQVGYPNHCTMAAHGSSVDEAAYRVEVNQFNAGAAITEETRHLVYAMPGESNVAHTYKSKRLHKESCPIILTVI